MIKLVNLNKYTIGEQMEVRACRNMHDRFPCKEKCKNRALCDTVFLEHMRSVIEKSAEINRNKRAI